MAKKKMTHQPKDHKQEAAQPPIGEAKATTIAMDEASEKLKSLNAMLVKETVERRQQIDSLVRDKETILKEFGLEKAKLESEVSRFGEECVGLELEKGVFCVFVETQIGEMGVRFDGLVREKVEIERVKREREVELGFVKREVSELRGRVEKERDEMSLVCEERDLLRKDFDGLVVESDGLRLKVKEAEKKEGLMVELVEKMKLKCDGLVEEKGRTVEELKREKVSVERNLVESEGLIENLKREIRQIGREKNEIASVKSELEVQNGVLEKELGQKNEIVLDLNGEVDLYRAKILDLEKFIGERIKEMEMENESLKREKEQNIEILQSQLSERKLALEVAAMESKDNQQRIEELIREKNETEELKVRNDMFALRNSCRDEEEKCKQLLSEVNKYKDGLESIRLQRNEAQKAFDEERKNMERLMLVVSEREKKIEEITEELKNLRSEHGNLLEITKVAESRLESLAGERDTVKKSLLEAESKLNELKAKVESAGLNSERALTMLKKTASLVSSSNGIDGKKQVSAKDRKLENEVQSFEAELKAIQSAFTNKDKTVEEMKKQLELMKNSVEEARKKKGFWTLITSATTILAAASVAYIAKGR
ncbi:hypothetical protein UlMin_029340 [Ulmus minor]